MKRVFILATAIACFVPWNQTVSADPQDPPSDAHVFEEWTNAREAQDAEKVWSLLSENCRETATRASRKRLERAGENEETRLALKTLPSPDQDLISGESAERAFKAVESSRRAVGWVVIRKIGGVYVRLKKLPEGAALTLGGEADPFDEGSWTLKKSHKKVLDELKPYLLRNKRRIDVRGHTSGNVFDSVILETGMDGSLKIRKFTKAELKNSNRIKKANHWMLGWLRANEIREYLLESFLSSDGKRRVQPMEDCIHMIQSAAYMYLLERSDRPLYNSEGGPLRAKNHRVEIILLKEDEQEK